MERGRLVYGCSRGVWVIVALLGVLMVCPQGELKAQGNTEGYRYIKRIVERGVNQKGDSITRTHLFSWQKKGLLKRVDVEMRVGDSVSRDSILLTVSKKQVRINGSELQLKLNGKGLCEETKGLPSNAKLRGLGNARAIYQRGKLLALDSQGDSTYYNYEWDAKGNLAAVTANGIPAGGMKFSDKPNRVYPYFNGAIDPVHFFDHLFARRSKCWLTNVRMLGKFNSNVLHEITYSYEFDKAGDPVRIVESNPYGVSKTLVIEIEYTR